MQNLRGFLTKNYFSYSLYAFAIVGIFPLLILPKETINIAVNSTVANYTIDPFFIYYSELFEGWILGVVVLAFALFSSRKRALMFILAGLISGLLIMLLKDGIIGNVPRPTKYVPLETYSHILKDVDIYKENYSFPSGHTTFAFSTMAMFAAFARRNCMTIFYFIIALGVAFSRIYLLQHFFVDIYCGAILGFSITALLVHAFSHINKIPDTPFFRKND